MKRVRLLSFLKVAAILLEVSGIGSAYAAEDTDTEEEAGAETVSEETASAEQTDEEQADPEPAVEKQEDDAEQENEEIQEETLPEDDEYQAAIETADNTGFQMNNIPVIYINIDESLGTIEEMNTSVDHSVNCYGSIDIKVPAGYSSEYMDGDDADLIELDLEYIRGRGNSSWNLDKKPYKIKLDKSTDLFGMGKNKHWVLLANRMDDTLIKNRITFWLSNAIGLEYTPQGIPVDVVMNGTYIGSYLLAEQVRVAKTRVDIPELEEDITEEPDITGGYLLSLGGRSEDTDNYIGTEKNVNLTLESPEFKEGEYENDAQKQYIKDYLQMMENAIFGEGFCDSEDNSYTEYLDIDSAIDYWWIQEFARNPDGFFTGSNYLYKDRNDKLYFGPVWDFDAAWNTQVSRPEGMPSTMLIPWYECLFTDPFFAEKTISRWSTIREYIEELIKEDGVITRYYEETKASQKYDETVSIDKNLVLSPAYIEDSKVIRGQELYFAEDHVYIPCDYYFKDSPNPFTILPEDAMDASVVWSSSDESIVRVEDDGSVYLLNPGTVTITGTLSSGKSYSYTLTSFDWDETGDDIPVEEIVVDRTSLTLQVGEYGHISVQILPQYASVSDVVFSSENPEIATVTPGGVVKGISPGMTNIIVSEAWGDKYTVCVVTVGEEEEPVSPAPGGDDPAPPEPENEPIPDNRDDSNRIDNGDAGYKQEKTGPVSDKAVPRTGDEQNMNMWIILMIISALIISICITAFAANTKRKQNI